MMLKLLACFPLHNLCQRLGGKQIRTWQHGHVRCHGVAAVGIDVWSVGSSEQQPYKDVELWTKPSVSP